MYTWKIKCGYDIISFLTINLIKINNDEMISINDYLLY